MLFVISRLYALVVMTGDRFVSYFCELNYSSANACQTLQLAH